MVGVTNKQHAEVSACLGKVLAHAIFVQSERLQRFLTFIVNETLAGHTNRLKGYTIGVEVFDRATSFDPAIDAIVRVEAARLRAKLREYYAGDGRSDPLRFDLPKGAYAVHIARREEGVPPNPPPPSESVTAGQLPKNSGAGVLGQLQPIEDRRSLAVLPFANMSSDPEQAYFADGITDGLITEISRLPGLFVISRNSSFVYKGQSKRAQEIGAELGVRYLLEGGEARSK